MYPTTEHTLPVAMVQCAQQELAQRARLQVHAQHSPQRPARSVRSQVLAHRRLKARCAESLVKQQDLAQCTQPHVLPT